MGNKVVHRRLRPAILATIAAAGLVLSACSGGTDAGADGGSATDVYDKINALTGDARHEALVAAAKEEGSVTFYTALADMEDIADAFEAEYGIRVDLYVAKSDTILQRVIQESQANKTVADVLDDSEAYTIADAGLGYDYVNPELTDDVLAYDPELQVVPTRLAVYTQAWNTNLVTDSEVPSTIDGWTDPSWKGKLSLDPRDWVWYTGLLDYYTSQGWSEEQVDDMVRTLASYSTFNAGHTVNGEFVIAGEYPASLSVYTDTVEGAIRSTPNAPIAWRKADGSYISPLVYQPQGSILMKDAPHPAAAMLLVDFLLTEGQQILSDAGTSTSVTLPGGALEGVDSADMVEVDYKKFTEGREEWTDRFNELIGQ